MAINPISDKIVSNTGVLTASTGEKTHAKTDGANLPQKSDVAFGGIFSDTLAGMFTDKYKFSSNEEKMMYKELDESLTGKDKANFSILYKTGRLQDKNSNDGSSTIRNLYNIYKNPRAEGLDNRKLLSETIARLANPFMINQKFGSISSDVATNVLEQKARSAAEKTETVSPNEPKNAEDMNIKNSACCVAASIEFSLADKKPAEFARFVEGLSSPKMEVVQKIQYDNLNKDMLDALRLLDVFNVKPKNPDKNTVEIKIAPDKDAIIRAKERIIRTEKRLPSSQNLQLPRDFDNNTRGCVDVLLQSAFMQLGSQNTYSSLTDKRYGSLNAKDTGLTEFEKTFVESVVNNDGEKTSVVYQNVNDNVLVGYYHSTDIVKKHILDALATNRNVIVGITETDENKKIIGGHEITIIGHKTKNGELYFICNDTDDDRIGAVEVSANALIPKIHHAGIPVNIISEINEEQNRGLELLRQYSKAA